MTIRPATAADVSRMIRLERHCPTAAHWTEQQYQHLFQDAAAGTGPERLVLAAEDKAGETESAQSTDERFLGFLVARRIASEWELENIVVAPASRQKGLGKRLLERLIANARATNSEAVFLEVRESNAAARGLYESAGFRPTGRRKSYYSEPCEDAVLYSYRIGSQFSS